MRWFVLSVFMWGVAATAFDYDVDMPTSPDPKVQLIRVTVDDCKTLFKVKKEDFDKFATNSSAVTQLVKKAIERSSSGCSD